MGIFHQQPNYTQSYSKGNAALLALKDLLAHLAPLVLRVTKVQKVNRVFKDPKVIKVLLVLLALKVLLVHQALVLVSHQGGIIIC